MTEVTTQMRKGNFFSGERMGLDPSESERSIEQTNNSPVFNS